MSERTILFLMVIVKSTSPFRIPGSKISCDDDVYAGSIVSSVSRPTAYFSGSPALLMTVLLQYPKDTGSNLSEILCYPSNDQCWGKTQE